MRYHIIPVLLLSATVVSAQPAPTLVRGRVVAAEHGAALPRARIEIISEGPSSMVFTDDDGRFTLPRTTDAPIRLLATKGGYAAATVQIPRATTDSVSELLVRLERGGAVAGRVIDPTGSPAVALSVSAQQLYENASDLPALEFSTLTDDLGEYRISGLPAGPYLVRANSSMVIVTGGSDAVQPISPAGSSLWIRETPDASMSQPSFWNGSSQTVRPLPAERVDIRADADVSGVDFRTDLRPPILPGTRSPAPSSGMSPETLARLLEQGVTGAIRGRVLTPSGEPIVAAGVRLLKDGRIASAATTDARGRFAFEGLIPDTYTLRAEKPGYLTLGYGEHHPVQTDETVALRPGATLEGMDIVLPRTSAIAGTIVDEHGEPLQGVAVRALRLQHAGGRMVVERVALEQRTDDRGRYRIFGLVPGTYVVMGSVALSARLQASPGSHGYAPVYAPGVTSADSAARVEVGIAQEIDRVDVTFSQSRTTRVSGRAVDSAGNPLAGTVILSSREGAGAIVPEPRVVQIGAGGAFAVNDVIPGEYIIQAVAARAPGRGAEFGVERISVGSNEPVPVTIRTSPGTTLEGRIVVEGQQSRVSTVSLVPVPLDPDRAPATRGLSTFTVSSSGAFYITGLYGPTRLALTTSSEMWYLKSVTIAGHDVTYSGHDFGLTHRELTDAVVEVAFASATVSGSVVDERGAARSDAAVVMFPTDREKWFDTSGHLKSARTFEDGSFVVRGLPPGEYWIVAVDRLEGTTGSRDWQAREVLEDLTSRASRLTIADGDQRMMNLRLIRSVLFK